MIKLQLSALLRRSVEARLSVLQTIERERQARDRTVADVASFEREADGDLHGMRCKYERRMRMLRAERFYYAKFTGVDAEVLIIYACFQLAKMRLLQKFVLSDDDTQKLSDDALEYANKGLHLPHVLVPFLTPDHYKIGSFYVFFLRKKVVKIF